MTPRRPPISRSSSLNNGPLTVFEVSYLAPVSTDSRQWTLTLHGAVLAELEACSFRNRSPAETAAHMKPIIDKYLPLSSSVSVSPTTSLERQKDHYSHFILRLAFASTEDLRRRFSRVETMLFRLRFQTDDLRERRSFVESLNFDWETISDAEKQELGPELRAAAGIDAKYVKMEEESWFKVDWERVPELVESRRVLLKRGKAYVPSKEQTSMVVAEFTSRLDKALEVGSLQYDIRNKVY